MIILLSIGYERSTDEVIDYFLFFKKKFIRINCDELKRQDYLNFEYDFQKNEAKINIAGQNINSDAKKVIWYRRLGKRSNIDRYLNNKINFNNSRLFSQLVFNEWELFLRIFVQAISRNTKWIDFPYLSKSKIDVLRIAKKNGLEVPNTFITNKINNFCNGNFITKTIGNTTKFIYGSKQYAIYTKVVKAVNKNFLPSLIQQKIEKSFEIRTFYIDGMCYSMAIFSQSDEQTKVDFRMYNFSKPNRTVPYKLPIEIEKKIIALMNELGLNSGSIDLIKSINGKFYFLEVNPVGQFGMTSKPCNYQLEKKIYEILITHETDFK